MFGGPAGRVIDPCVAPAPDTDDLDDFQFVYTRIPQNNLEAIHGFEGLGFKFIALDFSLERAIPSESLGFERSTQIRMVRKSPLAAMVHGFEVAGSRLSLDPVLRQRLPDGIWDRMIVEHAESYADMAFCAVREGRLVGFASCFEHQDALEIFLLAVHPEVRRQGIGADLLRHVADHARETGQRLRTEVVSANIEGFRFYLQNGFLPTGAEAVLHYTHRTVD